MSASVTVNVAMVSAVDRRDILAHLARFAARQGQGRIVLEPAAAPRERTDRCAEDRL